MNRDVLQGKWKQLRGKVKKPWGELTDNQLERINGNYYELVGILQEQYAYSVDRARTEVDHFLERQNVDSDISRW